jgi:hypothetical protein
MYTNKHKLSKRVEHGFGVSSNATPTIDLSGNAKPQLGKSNRIAAKAAPKKQ